MLGLPQDLIRFQLRHSAADIPEMVGSKVLSSGESSEEKLIFGNNQHL